MKQVLNPFLPQGVYIADGEPHVFGDRLYLIGSHDREGGDSFCLEGYEFYSAPLNSLDDWTSKGPNYSAAQDPLYGDDAQYLYAPDMVQGNDGRYYLYYCLAGWKGKGGYSHPISVAVCDVPDGHFEYYGVVRNPDGSPYLDWVCFDPAVINDEGTIRLYFGSGPFRGMQVKPWNSFVLSRVYAGVFGKPAAAFREKPGPLGANTAELEDDMLTLRTPPRRICDTPDFKGHAFFEGSSIRKTGDTYYFIYSSENNHELCYATSRFPDRDFRFRGTLVSNGDIGIDGRKEKDRANATGTTHGGIECVNGQWYVFYHRLSHGSDYSREAAAEKLFLRPDGSFRQAEMTSCGLNDGDLCGIGTYPATICCQLTNGHMPHLANQKRDNIPMISHEGTDHFLKGCTAGTNIVYKYFDLRETDSISVTARGSGKLSVIIEDRKIGDLAYSSDMWTTQSLSLKNNGSGVSLRLKILAGKLELRCFGLRKKKEE